MEKDSAKVCITGVSGFLGSWVLKTFLDCESQSFDVRGTVRDPSNAEKMQPLQESLGDKYDQVEFVAADLTDPESIDKAIEGCEYVVHTASPFPANVPKNEDDVIKPAVEGTKAVLEACHKHKVKKLVVTSSIVAIIDYYNFEPGKVFDEEDWLEDLDHSTPYPKSKTLAEKLVWEYVSKIPEDERFDVVTINPGFILGPILIKSNFSSAEILSKILRKKYPGMPDIYMACVDVRDVALAHLKAITLSPPNGRYILSEGDYEFANLGEVLYGEFNQYGYKPTRKKMKYCTAKIGSWFIPEAKSVIQNWGKNIQMSNAKSKEVLKMEYIDHTQTIVDMGYSLIDNGYVPDKRKK